MNDDKLKDISRIARDYGFCIVPDDNKVFAINHRQLGFHFFHRYKYLVLYHFVSKKRKKYSFILYLDQEETTYMPDFIIILKFFVFLKENIPENLVHPTSLEDLVL